MLAEANVPPDESLKYFGDDGDRLQMMLNFPVNQRLFYALATGDIEPLIWALEQTRKRPRNAQWVQFLRSHDELDLGRLTDEQRQKVFEAFGPRSGCSSTTAASGGGWRRCSATIAAASSSRSACCSRCRARR